MNSKKLALLVAAYTLLSVAAIAMLAAIWTGDLRFLGTALLSAFVGAVLGGQSTRA